MKEPDFSSPEFSEATERIVDQIVNKHAMHVLKWLLSAIVAGSMTIFGAAIWATKVYLKIQDIGASQARTEADRASRIVEWTGWRGDVEGKLRAVDARTADRWTRSSMRDYNSQLGTLNRTLVLPDVDIISSRQTAP